MPIHAPLADPPPLSLGVLLLMGGLLFVAGVAGALLYCDFRETSDRLVTRQLASLGERCVATLGEIKPAEMILAKQIRSVPVLVRDSARERRWTSP